MFESLRTIDHEDQRQTPLAKCLLPAIQCNKIVDEINQLSKREVVLQKQLLSKAGHAKSEPIHVSDVEVSCTQGTLKVNEKVCRRRMEVTYILLTFEIFTNYDIFLFWGFFSFGYRMQQTRMHFFIQLPDTWLETYGFTAYQLMQLTQN